MARTIRWSELTVGVVSAAALAAAVVSILVFARVGALHGDTSTLYVVTNKAVGVLQGTEVWLSGQKIGLVKEIHFRPLVTDTSQRLAIETEILADRMTFIRKNSFADVRPGGNLIGSPVVYIGSGTPAARPVRSGDTLFAAPESIDEVGARIKILTAELTALVDTGKKVLAQASSSRTSVGAFRTSGMPQITDAGGSASRLMAQATRGSGTIGLAMRGDAAGRFRTILAQKDSIILLLNSGDGNVGRFRRDSTLFRTVAGIRADLDTLAALVKNPASAMSRAQNDSTLAREIARVNVEFGALMADIKKNPLRYLSF